MQTIESIPLSDIPSHIMRELKGKGYPRAAVRYTLTYNEGTTPWKFGEMNITIYPHI